MTPAQFVEAAKSGVELHIPFEDAEDSDLEVYHLCEYGPEGTYAFFTQSSVGFMNTIHINIDTDGTMTVGSIYSYSIPKGVTKKTLWSGSASSGTTITLSDSLANYDYFVVQGFYGSTSYIFNISGVYSPTGYKGAGVNANGVFYSTGGFYYDITINITNSGSWSYYVGAKNSTSSFSSSLTLMQIIGYKFNT